MPSLHGVRSNGTSLDMRASTFVEAMRLTGYATALVGKSHIQNMTAFPPMRERPALKDGYASLRDAMPEAFAADPEGDYRQEHPERWRPGKPYDLSLPFYGFEHVDLCTEHSDHVGGHYYVWFKERRSDADSLRDRDNPTAARLHLSAGLPHGDPGRVLPDELRKTEDDGVHRPAMPQAAPTGRSS